ISDHSEIITDNIEIAKGRGSFPYDVSAFDIHKELEWNPTGDSLRRYPIMITDDGGLFYYR
ncbi:ubiquitin carboxyl-terminal hydrolase 47 isoform X1, partial [Paramuricea clavata]